MIMNLGKHFVVVHILKLWRTVDLIINIYIIGGYL